MSWRIEVTARLSKDGKETTMKMSINPAIIGIIHRNSEAEGGCSFAVTPYKEVIVIVESYEWLVQQCEDASSDSWDRAYDRIASSIEKLGNILSA